MDIQFRQARKGDLPPGAVVVTRTEALEHMHKSIFNHEPVRDVFALKYGGSIVAALAALSGVVMLKHFRSGLGLRKEAHITSNLTCAILPSLGSYAYHFVIVTPNIIMEDVRCSLCLELQSAGIQAFSGFILPYFMGMVTATMTAFELGANVPTPNHTVQFARLASHLTKGNNGPVKFAGLFFINVLSAIFLVQVEGAQLITFKKRESARRELPQN